MSEMNFQRADAVRRYFSRSPSPPIYAGSKLFAVLAAFAGLPALAAILIMTGKSEGLESCLGCIVWTSGVACFVLAAISSVLYSRTRRKYSIAYWNVEPKPSDQVIDAFHKDDLEKLKHHALEKLDLVPEQVALDNPNGPLTVVGSGPSPQLVVGKDNIVRFSSHEILVMYLTAYHLAAFKCVIDLGTGLIQRETTQEYHYNDVVSVSTQTQNSSLEVTVDGQSRQIPTHQRFSLSVASGEEIFVAIGFEGGLDTRSRFADTGAAAAIRSIRTRLREKKGGSSDLPASLD